MTFRKPPNRATIHQPRGGAAVLLQRLLLQEGADKEVDLAVGGTVVMQRSCTLTGNPEDWHGDTMRSIQWIHVCGDARPTLPSLMTSPHIRGYDVGICRNVRLSRRKPVRIPSYRARGKPRTLGLRAKNINKQETSFEFEIPSPHKPIPKILTIKRKTCLQTKSRKNRGLKRNKTDLEGVEPCQCLNDSTHRRQRNATPGSPGPVLHLKEGATGPIRSGHQHPQGTSGATQSVVKLAMWKLAIF